MSNGIILISHVKGLQDSYTKPPECVDIIRRTLLGFTAIALKALVLGTSAFRAPARKTE